MQNTCQAATGQCSTVPLADGATCSDGLACTSEEFCQAGKCKAGKDTCGCKSQADCAAQEDGDLCNGTLYCDLADHACKVNAKSVVSCSPAGDGPCTKNSCDKASGKCQPTSLPDGNSCDDGEPCSAGDSCLAGKCAAGKPICQCKTTADCAAKEDGDLCNGTLYCAAGQCLLNPASVVSCAASASVCILNQCQPSTGACTAVPLPDGATCDSDGQACTAADSCKQGSCIAGPNVCDCQVTADCKAKNDKDLCNGSLYCDKTQNKCKLNPATVIWCPYGADTPCLVNTCAPLTGKCAMQPVNAGGACDADGNPCTPNDLCKDGSCVADAPACSCKVDADCLAENDGNPCNGKLYCDKALGQCIVNPATVVKCATVEDTVCRRNLCNPATAKCELTNEYQGRHCDQDGNACTLYDVCKDGNCTQSSNLCDCYVDDHCGEVEDGDQCNGTLYCGKGAGLGNCKVLPSTVVDCKAGPCGLAACDAKTGQCSVSAGPDGVACSDGNACTTGDLCLSGACKGKTVAATVCNDQNPCTNDGCDPKTGCVQLPNTATCADDGLACTAEQCQGGSCKHLPLSGQACDDGEPCTSGDSCTSGSCKGAGPTLCDDKNLCTDDSCKNGQGCVTKFNGVDCDDGDACTKFDTCDEGECLALPVKCDDGNPCTVDSCKPASGCATAPTSGATCSDGNACTSGEKCASGQCQGSAITCDDKDSCTTDACDPAKGCTATPTPGCVKATALPYVQPFDCGGAKDWQFSAPQGGVAWAVDGTPSVPGFKSAACSLNYNNGTNYTCSSSLKGYATSPFFDAKSETGGLTLTYHLAGAWEGGSWDNLLVQISTDGSNWTTLEDLDGPGNNWQLRTKDISAYGGKLFQIRMQFNTADCISNSTSGAFIDDLSIVGSSCANDAACNDNKPCTLDKCGTGGKCTNTAADVAGACTDGNPCTKDACDTQVGSPTAGACKYTIDNTLPCDDGKICTVKDACSGGSCGGSAKCDDGDGCTVDSCDASTGACSTAPKNCNDNNSCTQESCVAGLCKYVVLTGGCDDGNPCTVSDTCGSSGCTGQVKCNDNNPCTTDQCSSGVCSFAPVVCDDKNPCTTDSCNASGQCSYVNDDTLKASTTCTPVECKISVAACSAGKAQCSSTKADPEQQGLPCGGGAGMCDAGVCKALPTVVSLSAGPPVKAGEAALLTAVVEDGDNDSAAAKDDIASVVADLSAIGGASAAALTKQSASAKQQTWTVALTTQGLAVGTWLLPVTVTDKAGAQSRGSAALLIFAGKVFNVGSGQPYATVADAVTAASSGDTVVLADGTYAGTGNKNLTTGGKSLYFASAGGAAKAIVDCAGAGRFLTMQDAGSPQSAVLSGLTIKGCGAGAVRVVSTGSVLSLTTTNCRFDSNSNADHGGALYLDGAKVKTLLVDTWFVKNKSNQNGGAIWVNQGELNVRGAVFQENSTVANSTIPGAGAIQTNYAALSLHDVTANGNFFGSQISNNARFLYANYGSAAFQRLRLHNQENGVNLSQVTSATFEGLQITKSNSAIYAVATETLKATQMRVSFSSSPVFLGGGSVTKGTIDDGRFHGGFGNALATNVSTTASNITIVDWDGGSGYAAALVLYNPFYAPGTLKNLLLRGCRRSLKGAAYLEYVNAERVIARDNYTYGALLIGVSTLRDSEFTGGLGDSGGVWITPGTQADGILIENALFANNAGYYGSGVRILATNSSATQKVTLRGLTFTGNRASILGGGLHSTHPNLTIENSIFWNNLDDTAGATGGDDFYQGAATNPTLSIKSTLMTGGAGTLFDATGKLNGGAGFVAGQLGNQTANPLFVTGPKGLYYLSQQASGQAKDSPAVNPAGGAAASLFGWGKYTTRTDGTADSGELDLGWHYLP